MIKVTLFLAPPPHVQAAYLPEWSHNDLSGREALNAHPSASISTTSERRFTSDNELALLAKSIQDSFYLSSALDAGIRNPKRGEILSFDGTRWINSQVALNGGGGQGVSELSKLLDVSLGAIHADDILAWDSVTNKWTNNNDRVIYAKGKASQTIEGNLLVTGNITAFAANGQVVSIWDSMPYATIDKVGGVRVSNVFTKGIRINNGILEIDPSYANEVDLTNYYTKPESNNLFALKTSIPSLDGYATQSWVTQNVIGAAPENLNALNELATALGNDPNFATTITNLIGTKSPINNPVFTGTPKIGVNDIIHSGNIGSQSVANADTVDGLHSANLALRRSGIYNNVDSNPVNIPWFTDNINRVHVPDYEYSSVLSMLDGGGTISQLRINSSNKAFIRSSAVGTSWIELFSQYNSNKLTIDWMANNLKSRTVKISDATGVTQWTAQLGIGNSLEFYNTSNVLEFRLSQSGKMEVRDNVVAYEPLT